MGNTEHEDFIMSMLFDMYVSGKQNIDISAISKECEVDESIILKLKGVLDERFVEYKC